MTNSPPGWNVMRDVPCNLPTGDLIGIDASRAQRARRTGTETYARRLIDALIAAAPHHHFRLYFQQPPADWPPVAPNVETVVLPRPRLWTHLALGPELARRPPDVFFEPAHVLPLQHPSASVVTVHDLGYEHFPEAHPRLQRWYLRLTTHWHVRAARVILADSHATRNDLIELYAADPTKVTVVYPGVDLEHFRPVRDLRTMAAVRAGYELPPRYFLYVGTLQPRKNLARLIEAFAAVAALDPEVGLVLAGQRGWLYDGLFAQVRRFGLEGRVHFPGYLPDEALPALLSGALAFVFPSLFEGFGLPILEAQACGTPVLTSTTSSCPEVAGDAALLVPPTDVASIAAGLRRLLTEPELRAHLVERGAANVGHFTWTRAAAETLAIMEGIGNESAQHD